MRFPAVIKKSTKKTRRSRVVLHVIAADWDVLHDTTWAVAPIRDGPCIDRIHR
jgi:hypothetical protein